MLVEVPTGMSAVEAYARGVRFPIVSKLDCQYCGGKGSVTLPVEAQE